MKTAKCGMTFFLCGRIQDGWYQKLDNSLLKLCVGRYIQSTVIRK